MKITIAICTYNNAYVLGKALESLCHLNCPENLEYEILIVNNNCTDNTEEMCKKYKSKLGSLLRIVHEHNQGLSYARNRALQEARAENVSFIDDDVKVDPQWLVAVANAFEKHSATIVGGKSYLIFPGKRPEWLSTKLEMMLSRLDYGDEALVDTDKDLFGLNFSVMRKDALTIGGFNPNFGRCGKSLSSGEETDFLKRIRKNGGIAVYEPSAIVGHIIPPERLTRKWFFKRGFEASASNRRLIIINGARPEIWNNLYQAYKSFGGIIKSLIIRDSNSREFFLKLGALVEDIENIIRLFRKSKHTPKI